MHPVIKKWVMPLVGKVSIEGFDKPSTWALATVQLELMEHTRNGDVEKLKRYLALCIQLWPKFSGCPVNRAIIRDAVSVIEYSIPL